MRLSPLISLSLLLLSWQTACAQFAPADDFFNGGAHSYISNNIPQALELVEGGLKHYPDDVKLKKLYELLKQQSQQQSQNSQSQQNQDQKNQSQQQKSNSQQNQQQQNQQQSQQNSQQQQKQNEQNQSSQKNAEQEKQQQQKASGEKQGGEKEENQNEQGQPVTAGQMTPEEAKRLLDAQKGSEQVLQLKPQGKPENQNRPIRDW
jgi:Mg-chelatase subunit ChlI